MVDLKDLQYLSALARHQHFAKAAAACGISQPAFSMRIRAIEDRLNTAIVKRGNRFQGFTPEGEAILRHGRRVLEEMRALEQEILAAQGEVSGILTLAVVPTAASYAARLAIGLHQAYPGVVARIHTASSLEIQQGIEDGSIDAGLTYADAVAGDLIEAQPIYTERYQLLAPDHLLEAPEGAGVVDQIPWAQAGALPLTLLEPRMYNRRIIDRMFQDIGIEPNVIAEASALSICVSMVCEGLGATIIPEIFLHALGPLDGTRSVPLIDPVLEKTIALVSAQRSSGLPTVAALWDVAVL